MKAIHAGSAVCEPVSLSPSDLFSSKPTHTPQVMEGEALNEVIDALVTEHQAELLAAEGAT